MKRHTQNHTRGGEGRSLFSVRGFRFHRQWAVDVDYLRRLPPDERKWLERFLSEYYDADNKLLRPEKHVQKCRACREGGDCGRRPPPKALHSTDALRRDCYNTQFHAHEDAYSRGRVSLWEDFERVDESGARAGAHGQSGESFRPRWEAGDYVDTENGFTVDHARPRRIAPKRR